MRSYILSFLTLAFLLSGQKAMAQNGGYWLNVSSGTYANLIGGTPVSGSNPWDTTYPFKANIGFSFTVGSSTTDTVYLHKINSFCTDTLTLPILNGFQLLNAALVDRGSATSASPIAYDISGTTGSRIFKLEINNAGFANEQALHATLNDYVNLQLWLYEGSNVVEIHFGPSHITYASDYFSYSGGAPIVGYCKRKNLAGDGVLYSVNGIASNISSLLLDDSTVFSAHAITYLSSGILGYPASGTVFKFTPIKAHVNNVNVDNAHIYPTLCKNEIMVDYKNAEQTTYRVISVKGIPITMMGTLVNGTTTIDLSKLAAGSYILELQNSTGKFVQKFVKL